MTNATRALLEAETAKERAASRKTASKVSDTAPDLPHLRKLFSDQEAAARQAEEKFVEAQRQLKALETETNRVRSELQRTQKELADKKEQYATDLRWSTEKEARLSDEVVAVRFQMTEALDRASGYKKVLAICVVLLITVIALAAANYWRVAAERQKTAVVGFAALSGRVVNALPHDVTVDVRRLDQALNHFRHESAEEVLRRVHDMNAARGISVCPFEWNGGEASLLFSDQPDAGLGITLTRCADAVEQAAGKTGS
jgi:hypothetical protein